MVDKRKPGRKSGRKTGMAHKARTRSQPRTMSSPTSWVMLLIGLLSGSALTALYLGIQNDEGSGIGSGLKWWLNKQGAAKTSPSAPPIAESAPIPAPKFDFYHILETERVVPETVFDEPTASAAREPGEYVLQVASYKSDTHADRLRAKLVLAGLDARMQKFKLADDSIVFRVVLGPYSDKRTLKTMRQKVNKLGLDAIVLRSK